MDSNCTNITPDVQYDDGVVCFGPMTESELERHQRLPRFTIVPSDIILSNSYFDLDEDKCSEKNTNKKNDQPTLNHLDETKENTTFLSNNSISFSSPCTSQLLSSNDKLIETDVINRYIRMEATSSDESKSFSEDQSDFEGEAASFVNDKEEEETVLDSIVCENVGFVDVQKTEVIHENSTKSKTPANPLETVSSIIELSNNENKKNVSEAVNNNVCTLKYSCHEESSGSVCTDLELEDIEDYSIVPDKYSITPGKQRLFDIRPAKSSLHVKSCSVSAPFMDRIDENTCPIVPKNIISHSVMNDVSYIPSVVETLEASSVNDIDCSSSGLNLNSVNHMMSDSNIDNVIDNTNKSVKWIDCSIEEKRTLDNFKCSLNKNSTNKLINILPESFNDQSHVNDENKPVATKLVDSSAVNAISDDTCNNTFLSNNESIQFNMSLNNSNVGTDGYDLEKCKNIMSITNVSILDYHKSDLGATSDDLMCTNKLSTNSESVTRNNSFNETNLSGNFSNATVELKFDLEESNEPKIIIPAINDEEILLNEKNSTNSSDVNCFKVPSRNVTQYLNFDQSLTEKCQDISTVTSTLNAFEDNCNQFQNNISVIEQTFCSETTDLVNKNDSTFDDHLKSKLSIIIENRTLEEEIMVQSDDPEKIVNNAPINSIPDNNLSVNSNNEILIKSEKEESVKSRAIIAEDGLNNHAAGLSLTNMTNHLKMVTENDSNVIQKCVNNSGTSLNESKDLINNITLDNCSLSINDGVHQNETNLIAEGDNQFENNITEQITLKDTENNDCSLNSFSKNNSIDFSVLNTSELLVKSENAMKNIQQEEHVLNHTNSLSHSLVEFNKIERMLLEEEKKVFEFKTPKTEKLLDFSIVQQSPFLVCQEKKQKLLNFSIVEQTPTLKTIQHTSFNHNHKKTDTLIDFSSVGQMLDLGNVSAPEIDFQESSSNGLMNISAPNIELLTDESIKTSSTDYDDLSFNQTITETNLNNPDNTMNPLNINDVEKFPEENNSIVLINKQIEVNEFSDSLNKTIAQNELYIKEPLTIEHKQESELLCTPLNTKSVDSNQKSILNSNKYSIIDFSIVKQSPKGKNIETITSVSSDNIASNLIDISVRSVNNKTSNNQSNTPIIVVSSHDEFEKTLNSCSSDDANNTAIHFEDSQHIHKEALTNIQINDTSLLVESPDKSSVSESFHSIELDHVQEDKKRKIEPMEESHINEKKMKVNTEEELKTPSSMLYKIRNMFRSSEKQLHHSRNEENSLRSFNVSCQKLNYSKCEENKASFAKPSKIPCKVTDISVTKSSDFNLSTSSLNDNIVKSKKTIPKLTGLPVLSDVSNSSTKKFPESRIPSKVQK